MNANASLSSDAPEVNLGNPFDLYIEWIRHKAESGDLAGPTASNLIGALRAFGSVVRADEPTDPASVIANLDQIARRWLNKNPANKSATTETYMKRVKFVMECKIAFDANSVGFRFPVSQARPKVEGKAKTMPTPVPPPVTFATPEQHTPPPGYRKYPIPLGPGRKDLILSIPEDESLTVNDCFRLLWGALLHASDFDPRNPQVIAMQKYTTDQQ